MPKRDVAIQILSPTEGIHKELGESFITARSTPNCLNANAYYGMVQKEYGTTLFATGTGAALGVPVNFIFEANFAANRTIQVFSHSGMFKYAPVLGTTADNFVLDSTGAAGTYAGGYTDFWSGCMHNGKFFYTNGVDQLQCKAAYTTTGTTMGGMNTGSYKAVAIVSFAEHLNIYNVTEAGVNSSKRIQWTKVGALALTATTDWLTGTAGFTDLEDMDGPIVTAQKMGNAGVAIYGGNSIHVQEWVGGTDVYRFTRMITNVGCPARRGVVADDVIHYFIGRDNIYMYKGGRDLTAIGDAIKPMFINEVAQTYIHTSFLDYEKEADELRVYVPTGTSTSPDTCYICKIKDNYAWYKAARPYTCVGKVTNAPATKTIGELLGDIGAQNWKFGDYQVKAGASLTVWADAVGNVVKADKTVYSLSVSGTQQAQVFNFDTKDLSSINDIDPMIKNKYNISSYMDNKSRWYLIKVEAKGNGEMFVDYSVDAGNTWRDCNPTHVDLDAEWDMYSFECDHASERFMIRVRNSGLNEVVHVRYLKVHFVPGSEV